MKAFILLVLIIVSAAFAETLLSVNFDNRSAGQYTKAMCTEDWQPQWSQGPAEGRVDVVESPDAYKGSAIRVKYPKGGVGPGEGGAQWRVNFASTHEQLYATYRLKFDKNFTPVKGGKLPGLCGKDCPTGGSDVTGTNGFSARYMWGSNLLVRIYCYHIDQPTQWGESFNLDYTFENDKWYELSQRIKMNTVGKADGEIQVWVDGTEALLKKDLRFRTDESVKVDRFYFSTFYGGNSADWAPPDDEYVYFDEFTVTTEPPTSIADARSKRLQSNSSSLKLRRLSNGDIVAISESGNKADIEIVDIKGRIFYTRFHCESLQPGVYLVRFNSARGWSTAKLAAVR